MEDEFLPGFKVLSSPLTKEEKEREFLISITKRIIDEESASFRTPRLGRLQRGKGIFFLGLSEDERLRRIVDYAKEHKIEIPAGIRRRLKAPPGAAAADLRKRGAIILQELYDSTPLWIPVSLETFKRGKKTDLLTFTREFGRLSISLNIVKPKPSKIPAAGDIAKRTFYLFVDYAQRQRTGEPGPIRFGDFLERLGLEGTNIKVRRLIKRYCDAFSYTSLLVRKYDEKGKEILYDYAPLFKRYTWEKGKGRGGEFGQNAEISPVFNEEFEKMIFRDYAQFVFVPRERLRGRPRELTDRDFLFQDWIRGKRGLPIVKVKIRNLLLEVFQVSEKEIYKRELGKIQELIIRNLEHAKRAGLVRSYKLEAAGKRADYLKGIIRIWPKKSGGGSAGVDPERLEGLLNRYCWWAYDPGNRFSSKMEEGKAREYLRNFVYAHGPEDLEELENVLEEAIADDPWFEEGGENTSSLIQFWEKVKNWEERKANKERLGR